MLPKMNENFSAFIAPARENPGGLLFFGATLFVFLIWMALSTAILGLYTLVISLTQGIALSAAFLQISSLLAAPNTPLVMVALLGTFIGTFCAVWLTVVLFRDQSLTALLGPGPIIRNFCTACIVVSPFLLLSLVLPILGDQASPNLPISQWLLWMGLALPLLLIQVSAEELIFRGFLLQECSTRFQSRWIWLVVPSMLFGMLHFDPTRFGSNSLLIVAATFLFGLIAADVTVRTGNLGAAIGLHFMNNLMAMMLLSLDGTMTGLSLYVTTDHVSDAVAVRRLLLYDFASIAALYGIYLAVMRWRERRAIAITDAQT
jgi:membrane protease YdiL (CAAX protease family)